MARDLKRRRARERNTLFVVEGVRAVEELLRSGIVARGALVTPSLAAGERGQRLLHDLRAALPEVVEIDDRDLATASHTDSPQGVLVVADVPTRSLSNVEVSGRMLVLLLDGVQDPGNAGTLLRTAAAFGVNASIALAGTVDLWSAKVVRSAMGTQFLHPAFHASMSEVAAFMEKNDVSLFGSEAGAPSISDAGPLPQRLALAVGNEGAGLSPEVRGRMVRSVGIATRAEVNSLNVSVAAGILLYEMCR